MASDLERRTAVNKCYQCFSCEAQRAAARKGHPDDVVDGLRRNLRVRPVRVNCTAEGARVFFPWWVGWGKKETLSQNGDPRFHSFAHPPTLDLLVCYSRTATLCLPLANQLFGRPSTTHNCTSNSFLLQMPLAAVQLNICPAQNLGPLTPKRKRASAEHGQICRLCQRRRQALG